MKTIKIGIIGAGRIGRVHAENIAKFVPEMEIKTIADPYMSEETVEFLRRLRIPNIVKDADVILNDPEIKAVVVCSPTDLHAEYAIKVAEAGKDAVSYTHLTLSLRTRVAISRRESRRNMTRCPPRIPTCISASTGSWRRSSVSTILCAGRLRTR